MTPALTVENLSKRYRLGLAEARADTLMGATASWLKSPLDNFRRLRRLSQFDDDEAEDVIWALREISFEIQQGEVVGIVGRNGAGKSTLLKILSHITEPSSGQAFIRGRVASLLEVGTGFHGELTGRENVYLNGTILGMSKAEVERKFDEIVDFSGVERFIDTPVKRYSSGMQVRLAFAVAAHLEPEILLIDEVLAVGDAGFQRKCLGKIGSVAKEGRTVLFVSHNMTAVQSLCQRTLLLDSGCIVADGSTGSVITQYLQTSVEDVLEQQWNDPQNAPGNEHVRFHRVALHTPEKTPGKPITGQDSIKLTFEVWNQKPDAVLNFSMHLFTLEGAYVFASVSDALSRHKGLVRGVVCIPPNLLNDGMYSVTIMVVEDTSIIRYTLSEALAFEVHNVEREGDWFGKWPGIVRPRLQWMTKDVPALLEIDVS